MGVDGIIIIGIDSTERVFDDEMPSDGSETFELSLFKKRKQKKTLLTDYAYSPIFSLLHFAIIQGCWVLSV